MRVGNLLSPTSSFNLITNKLVTSLPPSLTQYLGTAPVEPSVSLKAENVLIMNIFEECS